MGVSDKDPEAPDVACARDLFTSFLANRCEKTLQAYTLDIADFARFQGREPATAVAQLLAGGPGPGDLAVLQYAVDLRRRGRAQATVNRRLSTLRALGRAARKLGVITWSVEVPTEHALVTAMEEQPTSDSEHYL